MSFGSRVRRFSSRAALSASRLLVAGSFLFLAVTANLAAQEEARKNAGPSPTIIFTLDFPESNPHHYSLKVDAAGHTRYECAGKVTEDSEDETYRSEFELSPGNREQIFDWTKQAHFFAGNIDSGNKKLAFTGAKTLSYEDGQHSNQGRYNYSSLAPVRQLTALFQNIAATQEFGRKLAYYHRYQKLALDDELKRMSGQAKNNELAEIQGIEPVLKEIVQDQSVMNTVRARAEELIEMGNGATSRR